MKFNVGDLVELKSGGPTMTVEAIENEAAGQKPTIRCKWFSGKHLKVDTFSPEILKRDDVATMLVDLSQSQ